MRKQFGYVADAADNGIKPQAIPQFDQGQVDYLRKVFRLDFSPGMDIINMGAEKCYAYVCIDQGNRDVIDHIQSIIDNRKVTG